MGMGAESSTSSSSLFLGKRWRGGWGVGWGVCEERGADGVGRNREEMLVDGRLARARREGEVLVERKERAGNRVRGGDGREWWDVYEEEEGIDHDGYSDQHGAVEARREVW